MTKAARIRLFSVAMSLALTFIVAKVLDLIIGVMIGPAALQDGIAFPPRSTARYETSEFTFDGQTNSLGFRDREFDLKRSDKYRILAIGDSFTYGWGVAREQAWPKILEGRLTSCEVANLGMPGAGPPEYAETAYKAIAAMQPDLVVIAITLGDDLQQSDPKRREPFPDAWHRFTQHPLTELYPALNRYIRRMKQKPMAEPMDAAAAWKSQAPEVVKSLSPEERKRYEALPPEVQTLFMQGRINCAWVTLALRHPEYFVHPIADMDVHVRDMADRLRAIKRMTDAQGCKLLVVTIPQAMYTSQAGWEACQRLGFQVTPDMLTATAADDAVAQAARLADLPFQPLTVRMRDKGQHVMLHFPLDGHLNAAGQQAFGEVMADVVKPLMAR